MELTWLATAFLCGFVASRLYLPPLVGYLAAGYFLHIFNVTPMPGLAHLSDLGIELLLFSVGLKLKPSSLVRREVLVVGGLHLLLTALFSVLVFFLLGQQITGGLLLGLSLAFSSTVLAAKVLEDRGEASSFHGRDVLSILIMQDIVAIGVLAFAEGKNISPWALLLLVIPFLRPLAHRILSMCHSSELRLLMGFSLAIAGGALAGKLGVSPDIGALLMGIMLAEHETIGDLTERLWSLKELFLVAFFLQIGLMDLPTMAQFKQALLLVGLMPLQGIVFFALFILSRLRARTAFVCSLALMTYSEFALITTHAIVDASLLSEEWMSVISLAVAGSLAIAAPLNRFSHNLFFMIEPWLIRFERKAEHPDALPESFGLAEWLVIGMSKTGVASYSTLCEKGLRVIGLDSDPIVVKALQDDGLNVAYADTEDSELWSALPLKNFKGIILAMSDFECRMNAISQIRKQGYANVIGTICYQIDKESKLVNQGASYVIHPLVEAGNQLATKLVSD